MKEEKRIFRLRLKAFREMGWTPEEFGEELVKRTSEKYVFFSGLAVNDLE